MVQWRVYYGDGMRLSDCECAVEDLPGDNVIGLVQRDDTPGDVYAAGRQLLYDRDFYWWEEDRWVGGDLYGLFDYLRRSGPRKVIAGRTVHRAAYRAALSAMHLDPDFPRQTANV
jgi:hypothetical protein